MSEEQAAVEETTSDTLLDASAPTLAILAIFELSVLRFL